MPDVLSVIDDHTDAEMRLLGGFDGKQLVGMLPLFLHKYPGVRLALSPPPAVNMSRMGPVVMINSPKLRKQERLNQEFTEAVLNELDRYKGIMLYYMILDTTYTDPRPYRWAGFRFEPRYTYQLDLRDRGADEVIAGFSRNLRWEIQNFDDHSVEVSLGGVGDALRVYDDTKARFAEQGAKFPVSRAFTRDLISTLDDSARVYTATGPDGEYLGGITVLYSDTTAYFWLGGTRANYQNQSVNSFLHWQIIQDILSDPTLESVERYDLGRAAVKRLGRYKSKFNPELVPYYEIKSSRLIDLAKEAYKLVSY
ncbi:GNAT family N-acetyltransferase [Haloferax sp. CBA1149]|nr:GNAT family N-acetyltransferase [Haloferax sp. CBA1149]